MSDEQWIIWIMVELITTEDKMPLAGVTTKQLEAAYKTAIAIVDFARSGEPKK